MSIEATPYSFWNVLLFFFNSSICVSFKMRIWVSFKWAYACVHIHVHMCMYPCLCVWACLWDFLVYCLFFSKMSIYMCSCKCSYMYIYIYTRVCLCACKLSGVLPFPKMSTHMCSYMWSYMWSYMCIYASFWVRVYSKSLSANVPLSIGLFCGNCPEFIRHPRGLHYPLW